MPDEPITTPRLRPLLLVGAAAITLAGAVVVAGFVQRAQAARETGQWTQAQAIPTVALAKPPNNTV